MAEDEKLKVLQYKKVAAAECSMSNGCLQHKLVYGRIRRLNNDKLARGIEN